MIGIVDYGLGNVSAFANVYKKLNIPYCFADSPAKLERSSKIILPGVGAFDYALSTLGASGMRETLDHLVLSRGIPVLGVCVGMQIMANSSEEGNSDGLGWIPGIVKKITCSDQERLKEYPLPHMGWNHVVVAKEDVLFSGMSCDSRFYFLHSYYFECADSEFTLATTEYGSEFSCIVKRNNIYGVQCHPEKSHHNGITLLRNFALA